MKKFFLLLILFFSFNVYGSNSELVPYKKHALSFSTENDLYAIVNTDRYYTNGIRLKYISKEYDYSKESNKMEWGSKVTLAFLNKPHITRFSLGIAQEMYTPILYVKDYELDAHPYGGYLYFTGGIIQRNNNMQERIYAEVGVIGPYALAKPAQDFIHDITWSKKFQGWEDQIANEPVINIKYEILRKDYLFQTKHISMDMINSFGASLGNGSIYGEYNFMFRLGHNLSSDFGPSKINQYFDSPTPISDDPFAYLFFGTGARLVGRNIFIQGNTFGGRKFDYKLNVFRFDSSVGMVLGWKGYRLGYTYNIMSKEYAEQATWHNFGTFFIDISF